MGGLTAVDHFFHRVHLIFCNIKGNTGLARSVRLQNTCFCPTVCKDVKYIWLCDLQFTIVCKRVHFLLSGLLSAFSFNAFLSCDKHPTNPLFPIHSVNVRPLPILFFFFFFFFNLIWMVGTPEPETVQICETVFQVLERIDKISYVLLFFMCRDSA